MSAVTANMMMANTISRPSGTRRVRSRTRTQTGPGIRLSPELVVGPTGRVTRRVALTANSGRDESSLAIARHLGRQVDRREQVGFVGLAGPGDVVGGAVVDRRADNRQ